MELSQSLAGETSTNIRKGYQQDASWCYDGSRSLVRMFGGMLTPDQRMSILRAHRCPLSLIRGVILPDLCPYCAIPTDTQTMSRHRSWQSILLCFFLPLFQVAGPRGAKTSCYRIADESKSAPGSIPSLILSVLFGLVLNLCG